MISSTERDPTTLRAHSTSISRHVAQHGLEKRDGCPPVATAAPNTEEASCRIHRVSSSQSTHGSSLVFKANLSSSRELGLDTRSLSPTHDNKRGQKRPRIARERRSSMQQGEAADPRACTRPSRKGKALRYRYNGPNKPKTPTPNRDTGTASRRLRSERAV